MSNLALVQKAYDDFAEGNIEAVLAVFDSDISWNECKGFPYVVGDGHYQGRDSVLHNVLVKLPEYFTEIHIKIDQLFSAENKVVMVGHYEGIWKPTGKSFRANVMHTWTIENNLLTSYFQAADTATIIN